MPSSVLGFPNITHGKETSIPQALDSIQQPLLSLALNPHGVFSHVRRVRLRFLRRTAASVTCFGTERVLS